MNQTANIMVRLAFNDNEYIAVSLCAKSNIFQNDNYREKAKENNPAHRASCSQTSTSDGRFSVRRIRTIVTLAAGSSNLHVTATTPSWNVNICEPYLVRIYTDRGSADITPTMLDYRGEGGSESSKSSNYKCACDGAELILPDRRPAQRDPIRPAH